MSILEDLKEYTERTTGLGRPGKRNASELARARKPHAIRLKDYGLVPNHPRWPLIIYRGAVDLDERVDPAAVMGTCSRPAVGATPGVTVSTTTCTITPGFMRWSASRAAVRFGGNSGRTSV
jgi:hypothetical protein